ncbi:MAG: histidine phosphatase family protein [Pseudomonadota bacterium]
MHLVLLRHTPTAVGTAVCYGDDDVPLADSHRTDINHCVQQLPQVDHIITSPLVRCQALAAAVAERQGVTVDIDHHLKEMHFGHWQGHNWSDISRDELDMWAADYEAAKPHGGESVMEFRRRVRQLLTTLAARFLSEQRILLVTHAGVIRSILTFVDPHPEGDYDERDFQIDYGQWLDVDYSLTTP